MAPSTTRNGASLLPALARLALVLTVQPANSCKAGCRTRLRPPCSKHGCPTRRHLLPNSRQPNVTICATASSDARVPLQRRLAASSGSATACRKPRKSCSRSSRVSLAGDGGAWRSETRIVLAVPTCCMATWTSGREGQTHRGGGFVRITHAKDDMMEYVTLGKTGLRVSVAGLGCGGN